MNIVVFASRKGGTGKSTLAAHLAAHASLASNPCLLLDADPQGSLGVWRGLRAGEGGPEVRRVARSVQSAVVAAEKEGRRWVFVDTPPNLSAVVREALGLATLVVIPARPGVFDLAAVRETIEVATEMRKAYIAVINSAPAKRGDVESPLVFQARRALERLGAPVWGGQITQRNDFSLALAEGASIRDSDPDTAAATEIARLWSTITRSVKAVDAAGRGARVRPAVAA